jgi:hypothetical protein
VYARLQVAFTEQRAETTRSFRAIAIGPSTRVIGKYDLWCNIYSDRKNI